MRHRPLSRGRMIPVPTIQLVACPQKESAPVSTPSDFKPGLEGVVAFETEIAEPDKEGGALRYRGVDIEELVGVTPYEHVWGLLVDDSFEPGMPRAEDVELPVRTRSVMADLQAATSALAGR